MTDLRRLLDAAAYAIHDPSVASLLYELVERQLKTEETLRARIEVLENDLNTVWPDRAWSGRYECSACAHQCEEY